MNNDIAHTISNNTMASDAGVVCSRWTHPTVNGGDLVVNCLAVGRYRAPVKGDVPSIKVNIRDTDITRCIKRIYRVFNLLSS